MPHEVLQRKRERLERAGNMSVEQRQQLLQDLLNQHKSYMVRARERGSGARRTRAGLYAPCGLSHGAPIGCPRRAPGGAQTIKSTSMQCPTCGMAIQKSEVS